MAKEMSARVVKSMALSGVLLVGGLSGAGYVSANEGDVTTSVENTTVSDKELNIVEPVTVKAEEETKEVSYNPTEPDKQLGDISEVSVTESGAVTLDIEDAQGQLDEAGDVAIDGVKGKGKIYYILEKSGDIISVHVEDSKITGTDGSTVKIVDVDAIHGNNGTADGDGFKSNLIQEDILPKTGLAPTDAATYGLMASFLGLMGIGIGVQKRRKEQAE